MAIINTQTRVEGNKAIPASANIVQFGQFSGLNPYEDWLGIGSQLQTNVEIFDQAGVSLGIQGLDYLVAGTEPGFDPSIGATGGIRTYDFMKFFCKQIENGWDPTVSCWATQASNNMAVFNIAPKGSDGAPFPARVSYELARIRDWVYVPVAI